MTLRHMNQIHKQALGFVEQKRDTGPACQVSEAAVEFHCLRMGYQVLQPRGVEKYDLLLHSRWADDSSFYIRAQVKTARLKNGAIKIRADGKGYTRKDWDVLMAYCPETDDVYRIGWDDLPPSMQLSLQVEPTKNGQRKNIRWAKDYSIGYSNAWQEIQPIKVKGPSFD